VREHRPAVR